MRRASRITGRGVLDVSLDGDDARVRRPIDATIVLRIRVGGSVDACSRIRRDGTVVVACTAVLGTPCD
jgi:hypothetical protein